VELDAYEVPVIVERDGQGYYAHCPGLPGLHGIFVPHLQSDQFGQKAYISAKLKIEGLTPNPKEGK